jgi:hypothetical protein
MITQLIVNLPIGILGFGYRLVRCSRWLYFRLNLPKFDI